MQWVSDIGVKTTHPLFWIKSRVWFCHKHEGKWDVWSHFAHMETFWRSLIESLSLIMPFGQKKSRWGGEEPKLEAKWASGVWPCSIDVIKEWQGRIFVLKKTCIPWILVKNFFNTWAWNDIWLNRFPTKIFVAKFIFAPYFFLPPFIFTGEQGLDNNRLVSLREAFFPTFDGMKVLSIIIWKRELMKRMGRHLKFAVPIIE